MYMYLLTTCNAMHTCNIIIPRWSSMTVGFRGMVGVMSSVGVNRNARLGDWQGVSGVEEAEDAGSAEEGSRNWKNENVRQRHAIRRRGTIRRGTIRSETRTCSRRPPWL